MFLHCCQTVTCLGVILLLIPCSVVAQLTADHHTDTVETTAAEIERLRQQKLQNLRPDTLPWLHRTILYVRENRIPEKITYGYKGFRPRFGTLGPVSGFGTGVEYYRPTFATSGTPSGPR